MVYDLKKKPKMETGFISKTENPVLASSLQSLAEACDI